MKSNTHAQYHAQTHLLHTGGSGPQLDMVDGAMTRVRCRVEIEPVVKNNTDWHNMKKYLIFLQIYGSGLAYRYAKYLRP